ncbi:MAG: CoA pyrophosphatase [Comamonadaceae bacterium]|uniref:NUDIX hydrolase n=1 Tax=Candidatus Skiveiella danica TaxID=3386177 RepID=UPI001D4FF89E|nr:CoA pyrophosphatase [Comamonadaceae bacterium]MBK7120571.1 CoA pyrophosphatase [Comamonadaceae bacterium]MBK7510085.1 CoA pyrophosphatase [Comamonadaceae bacterium]MBK9198457.1 CoA pyrophosphatase [Betaproteobacteria bacterium]
MQSHRARRLPGRHWMVRCGVVLLIAEQGPGGAAPALLMMRRAERAGDPWSGQVSFPGGRVQVEDADTRAAALRELSEETGLQPDASFVPIGRLSDLLTREHGRQRPMVVTPYVYQVPRALAVAPGAEAARLWWEPLTTLVDTDRQRTQIWRVAGLPLPFPAIEVSGARLWGLSLMMVKELVRATGLKPR